MQVVKEKKVYKDQSKIYKCSICGRRTRGEEAFFTTEGTYCPACAIASSEEDDVIEVFKP